MMMNILKQQVLPERRRDQRAARVEQHLCADFGPAHMLFLLHPPVYQLDDSRLHPRGRYAMAFAKFSAVVDQSRLVCDQVRPQLGQTLANLSSLVDGWNPPRKS